MDTYLTTIQWVAVQASQIRWTIVALGPMQVGRMICAWRIDYSGPHVRAVRRLQRAAAASNYVPSPS